jgi:hypothetical protein
MNKSRSVGKIQQLEMQLEEAIQMLRLVAANKRTCLEVEEWLNMCYPENTNDEPTIAALLKQTKGHL